LTAGSYIEIVIQAIKMLGKVIVSVWTKRLITKMSMTKIPVYGSLPF